MSSFFRDKRQLVMVNNKTSSASPVTCEIPQKAVLGPLLFQLFINNIKSVTTNGPKLFANDNCIILQNPNRDNLKVKISQN